MRFLSQLDITMFYTTTDRLFFYGREFLSHEIIKTIGKALTFVAIADSDAL